MADILKFPVDVMSTSGRYEPSRALPDNLHEQLRVFYNEANKFRTRMSRHSGHVIGAWTDFNDGDPDNYYGPESALDAIRQAQAYSLTERIDTVRALSSTLKEVSISTGSMPLFLQVPLNVDSESRTVLADSPFLPDTDSKDFVPIPKVMVIPDVLAAKNGRSATSYLMNRRLIAINAIAPVENGSGGRAATSFFELPERDDVNLAMTTQIFDHLMQLSLISIYRGVPVGDEEMIQYFNGIDQSLLVFFGQGGERVVDGMKDRMFEILNEVRNTMQEAYSRERKDSSTMMMHTNTRLWETIPAISEQVDLAMKKQQRISSAAQTALLGAHTLFTANLAFRVNLWDKRFLLSEGFRSDWLGLAPDIEAILNERLEVNGGKTAEQMMAEKVVELVSGDNEDKIIGDISAHLLKTSITSILGYKKFIGYPNIGATGVIARNFERLVETSWLLKEASGGRITGEEFENYLLKLSKDMLVNLDVDGVNNMSRVPTFFVATLLELLNDAESYNPTGELSASIQYRDLGSDFALSFTDEGVGIPDTIEESIKAELSKIKKANGGEVNETTVLMTLNETIKITKLERMLAEIQAGYNERAEETGKGGRGKALMVARVLEQKGKVFLYNRGKAYAFESGQDDEVVLRIIESSEINQLTNIDLSSSTTGFVIYLPKEQLTKSE